VKTEFLILLYVLFQILMFVAIRGWIAKGDLMRVRQATLTSGGAVALATGTLSRRIAWGVLIVFLVLLVMPILDAWEGIEGFSWFSFAFGAAWLLCGSAAPWLLIVWVYGPAFLVSKEGITKISTWRKSTVVRWNEITSVRFVPLYDMFVVKSPKGRMSISPLLVNIDSFAKGVIENVPKNKWQGSEKYLTKALSGPFRPDW
jgi:hypothetical protein